MILLSNHLKILRIFSVAAMFAIMEPSFAVVQTLPYISLDGKPQYTHVNAMPYANPDAPKGGEMSFATIGTFDNFNSMNGKGSAAEGVQYLYDSLMKSSLNEPGVLYPLLAKSVTYDPDKPSYAIFHLNPTAKFSDGSPVTAQDVQYTFEKLLTEGAPGIQIYFSGIKQVKALNRYDVRFDFHSNNNKEMPLIVANISIFSKKDLQHKDFKKITLQAPMGSGPYQVKSIEAGRKIIYSRNPNYWAKDLPINKGAYNVDTIKYIYYRSLEIAFEGFKAGQYYIHQEYSARNWVSAYQFNAAKNGLVRQYIFQHHNPIPTQSFVFNTRRKPLDDIYLRQALTYAYDFEWQNKALFYGQYKRLQSFFDNSELAATGKPSAAEIKIIQPYWQQLSPIMKNGFLQNWHYPISDASGFNRQNLLLARKILLTHGYRYNKKGQLLDKNGKIIRLEFLIAQDNLQRTLMSFIRNCKRLGIEIHIRKVDMPQYIERRRVYDYDIVTDILPQSLNPGNEQARFWSSQSADQAGNYNYAGIKNPVIDAIIQQLIHAENRQALIDHTKVLDRLLRAGYYQILTYGKGADWYAYWDMYEQPKISPQLYVGMDYWWVNPKKAQKIQRFLK